MNRRGFLKFVAAMIGSLPLLGFMKKDEPKPKYWDKPWRMTQEMIDDSVISEGGYLLPDEVLQELNLLHINPKDFEEYLKEEERLILYGDGSEPEPMGIIKWDDDDE